MRYRVDFYNGVYRIWDFGIGNWYCEGAICSWINRRAAQDVCNRLNSGVYACAA